MLVNRDGLIAKQDDPAGLNLLEIRFIAALVIFVIACRHINRFQLGMIDGVEEFLQLFRRRVFVEQDVYKRQQDGRSAQWLEIENDKLRVRVSDYGATLVSLWVKDAQLDAVLGLSLIHI